jgi:glycosyltransferase involved in cell wall biosynthesis
MERIFSVVWQIEIEVIAVNDASKDSSGKILSDLTQRYPNLRVIEHPANCGKGAAIRTALASAVGDIVAIQDADLEYDPNDLTTLLEPILTDKADVVYGSRFLKDCKSPKLHQFVNKCLTTLSNLFTGLTLTDMETCYKVFRRDLVKNMPLRSDRFGIEPELTAKLARLNVRFIELPISYAFRNYAEGKKITWWDGVKALTAIVYFRFWD